MPEDIDNKPLTVKDVREVLIPAMEGVFATKKDLSIIRAEMATKKDLGILQVEIVGIKEKLKEFVTKDEFHEFKNEVLSGQDKILKDLEILMTEKEMGYYQKQKERKLWSIMIDALQKRDILSSEQLKQIKELEIF